MTHCGFPRGGLRSIGTHVQVLPTNASNIKGFDAVSGVGFARRFRDGLDPTMLPGGREMREEIQELKELGLNTWVPGIGRRIP